MSAHAGPVEGDPRQWTVAETAAWLRTLVPKGSIPARFEEHGVDGAALFDAVTYSILRKDLGIRVGAAMHIMRQVQDLQAQWGIAGTMGAVIDMPSPETSAPESPVNNQQADSWSDPEPLEEQTVTRLVRLLTAAHVGRAVPQRIALVSAEFAGSWDPSDSERVSDDAGVASPVPEPASDNGSAESPMSQSPMSQSSAPMDISDTSDTANIACVPEDGELDDTDDQLEDSELVDGAAAAMDEPVDVPVDEPMDISDISDAADIAYASEDGELDDPPVDSELIDGAAAAMDEPVDEPMNQPVDDAEPKPRKRIAPVLVSADRSEYAGGNIAGDDDSDDGEPPVPSLPVAAARVVLAELFTGAAGRRARQQADRPALPAHQLVGFLQAGAGDAFWFRRSNSCRLTIANIGREQRREQARGADGGVRRAALWSQMLSVQLWHRRFVIQCDAALYPAAADADESDDPALPLYGESGSEAEFSDGLQREMAGEHREAAQRAARAAHVEQRRVAMVGQVVQEMVERYARDWQTSVLPQLQRKAHYLWGRHFAGREALESTLADLSERRLAKAKESVVASGVATRAQATVLCEALRVTVEDIARTVWLLQLTARPRPLPVSAPDRPSPPLPKSNKEMKQKQSAAHGSDSSDDGMSDFIDDTDDPGHHAATVVAPVEIDPGAFRARRPPVPRLGAGHSRRGPRHMGPARAKAARVRGSQQPILLEEPIGPVEGRVADTDSEAAMTPRPDAKPLQPRMQMTPGEMALLLSQHSAQAMYSAATSYIRRMAVGGESLNALADGKFADEAGGIGLLVALRMWAEFQNWIVVAQPVVTVCYSSVAACVRAQQHLALLLRSADPGNVAPDNKDAVAISQQLTRLATSIVKCPVPEPALSDRQGPLAAAGSEYLDVPTAQKPGILSLLGDGGEAKRAAFAMFYEQRRASVVPAASDAEPAEEQPDVKPGRTGRRNIKAIREENEAVLSMRRQHLQAEEAIERRLEEWKASQQLVPTDGGGNVITIVSDDDGGSDGDDEVLVSSSTAAPAAAAANAVDISRIGCPILINAGHAPDQQDAMIPGLIAGHLKEHQIDGVRFMWRNIVMKSDHRAAAAAVDRRRRSRAQHGCVLAHSMGLGKTLQTIALVYTLLNEVHRGNPDFDGSMFQSRRVLILCPVGVVANWAAEFWKWTGVDHTLSERRLYMALDGPLLPPPLNIPTDRPMTPAERQRLLHTVRAVRRQTKRVITQVVQYSAHKTPAMQLGALRRWHAHGGVLIMGYEMFRNLMQDIVAPKIMSPTPAEVRDELRRLMVDDGPALVIADEGHTIKNNMSQLTSMARQLATKARICLTGYPLQNNLEEYWTMVDFCCPGYLNDLPDFRNRYVNPIKNGLYTDSTALDKRQSTLQMRTLQGLLEKLVDRRDSSVLYHQLPRMVQYNISCPLTPVQHELYCRYLSWLRGTNELAAIGQAPNNNRLFEHGSILLTICNHPAVCQRVQHEIRRKVAGGAGRSNASTPLVIQDDVADLPDADTADQSAVPLTLDSVIGQQAVAGPAAAAEWCRATFAAHVHQAPLDIDGGGPLVEELQRPAHSTKVLLLLDIVRQSVKLGERVLVFMRSIPTLDYLQWVVDATGAAQPSDLPRGDPAARTLRIDGHTPGHKRQALIDMFNHPTSRHHVFFITSKTGSIGINLVAASRVVLFDMGWNPLYDEQAVARAYRYGQTRRVYVYRLLTTGTWENHLFNNNIFKIAMTRRVVDRQTMGRRTSREDAKRYFQPPPATSPAIAPDDVTALVDENKDDFILADILARHAPALAEVTPQATLLANEDDNVLIDETELRAVLLQEKRRLGLLPPEPIAEAPAIAAAEILPSPLPPPLPQLAPQLPPLQPAATTPAAAPAALATTQQRGPIDIRTYAVHVADGMMRVILLRLNGLRIGDDQVVHANRRVVMAMLESWIQDLRAFVAAGTAAEQRQNMGVLYALGSVHNPRDFCDVVPGLYRMDNAMLMRFLQTTFG
ncbi:hypothetical protein H4R19_000540 [Coemansia spiralis]|nr:hypothetical protein H4R19_000540 [Coemansia spiralis]